VRVVSAGENSIAAKRNLALARANGDYVAWFDDDDWQHPERLATLMRAMSPSVDVVGAKRGLFVDLGGRGFAECSTTLWPIFNGALFRRDAVAGAKFDVRA